MTSSFSTVLWGVSTTLQIGAVASNAPILLVIWSRGLLTSPNTRLVFNLCLSHLLLCIFLLISSWVPWLEGGGALLLPLVSLIVQLASLATLTLISLDRYVSISRPMECSRILTPSRALGVIGLSWGSAVVLVVPPGVLLSNYGFWWNLYFGLILSAGTLIALVLMTLAYSHIFAIARQKCAKVRLGEFRRAAGSISSEWGTSVGCGRPANLPQLPPPLSRGFSSQSLLQKLLQQRTSSSSTASSSLPSSSSPSSRSGSGSSGTSSNPPASPPPTSALSPDAIAGMARAKRRWRAYLRHNYNSPKKTVVTILALIGSVVVCSLPPALALLFLPSLFPAVNSVLLPLSSNLHPLLYGLLNRAIRHHLSHGKRAALLPKSLRRKRGQHRKVSTLGELRSIFIPNGVRRGRKRGNKKVKGEVLPPTSASGSRRGSSTCTEEEETRVGLGVGVGARPRLDTGGLGARWAAVRPHPQNPVVILVEDEEEGPLEEIEVEVDAEIRPGPLEIGGRRKSSQDSGADMNFSETEEDEEIVGGVHNLLCDHTHPFLVLTGSQSESNLVRGPSCARKYSHTHSIHQLLHPNPGGLQLSPLSLSADAHLHILTGPR